MERAVDILIGVLAGLLVGLGTIFLGMLGTMGGTPPDALGAGDRCTGLIVALLVVGAVSGGLVARRLGRNRSPERQWRRRRRWMRRG